MSNRTVLALDLGTSALKAGVVAADGSLRRCGVAAFGPVAAHGDGRVEGDPRAWLEGLRSACHELRANGATASVGAVVVTGHGPSLVAVDERGDPVGEALLWLDKRAAAEAREVERAWGRPIDASYLLPKILWLARHEPESYRASRYLLSCPELLVYRLTGNAVTMLHTPAFQHYYWREDVVEALGLDTGRLAPFVSPGRRVGEVTRAAARDLGLVEGLPVFAGGPDFLMSLVGTSCVRPGEVCDRAGSSEGVNYCSEREVMDPRLACHPHLVPPLWNVAAMVPTSGLAVDWIRAVTGRADQSHEALFESIAAVPPGSRGLVFRPFGDRGVGGEFLGLSLGLGHAEMARAVVESVGMEIRRILGLYRENGLDPRRITVTGGQARLDRWCQIKADITGLEVCVPRTPDAELVGAAAVGFVALGVYPDIVAATDTMVSRDRIFRPDTAAAARYDELRREGHFGSSSSR